MAHPPPIGFNSQQGQLQNPQISYQPGASVHQHPQQHQQFHGQPSNYGPPSATGVAPGLAVLQHTDRLVIKQKKEMLEIFTSWETKNRYEIYNGQSQLIMYAAEDTSGLDMCFFGENRPFNIRVLNLSGQQVMVIQSSVDCCTREVTVQVPPGQLAAQIKQEFAFVAPSFYVNGPAGDLVFKVKSPMSAGFGVLGNVTFDILARDQQTVVGQISKQWGGFFREMVSDADTFGLSLPADMDVMWKAILLAVTFVVDFEFYEKSNR